MACLACERGLPTQGRRRCPACGHVFRGAGWDGVEAHWSARHADLTAYLEFWDGLCEAHRARGALTCPSCRKDIPASGPPQCPECAQVFRGGARKLDAHWKARHLDVMSYQDFLAALCPAHRLAGQSVLPFGG
jgi:hypothetical protein